MLIKAVAKINHVLLHGTLICTSGIVGGASGSHPIRMQSSSLQVHNNFIDFLKRLVFAKAIYHNENGNK